MRRFVIEAKGGELVGVECEDLNWGIWGVLFSNRTLTDRGNYGHQYIVLYCAPETYNWLREIPIDSDWMDGVKYIHTATSWGALTVEGKE